MVEWSTLVGTIGRQLAYSTSTIGPTTITHADGSITANSVLGIGEMHGLGVCINTISALFITDYLETDNGLHNALCGNSSGIGS